MLTSPTTASKTTWSCIHGQTRWEKVKLTHLNCPSMRRIHTHEQSWVKSKIALLYSAIYSKVQRVNATRISFSSMSCFSWDVFSGCFFPEEGRRIWTAQRCSLIMKLREYSWVFAVGHLQDPHKQNERKTLTVWHTADFGLILLLSLQLCCTSPESLVLKHLPASLKCDPSCNREAAAYTVV